MADTATPEDAFSREAGGDAAPAPVPAPGSAAEGGAIEASGPADAPPSPPRSADPGSRRNTLARKLNTLVNNVLDRATPDTEPNTPVMARISMLRVRGAEGELPARLYVPLGAGVGPQPGILFFHGGGFVFGGLDTHDMICKRLAHASRMRVLSVAYRKAPRHTFPAAHDDALAAWHWLEEHSGETGIDPERVAVAGDSAGGNLAAHVAQSCAASGGRRPAFQLLLYPLVQFIDIRTAKLKLRERGGFISPALFDYFRDAYLPDPDDRHDPRVSPLFAEPGAFKGSPPAHLVLCGWDPLRPEGQAYADKLASCGVRVGVRTYPRMVHGFMNLTAVSRPARQAIQDAGEVAGDAFGVPVPD